MSVGLKIYYVVTPELAEPNVVCFEEFVLFDLNTACYILVNLYRKKNELCDLLVHVDVIRLFPCLEFISMQLCSSIGMLLHARMYSLIQVNLESVFAVWSSFTRVFVGRLAVIWRTL